MKGPSEKTIENYRKGCFTDKKPEDCHLLAEFMSLQENDWKRANAIYKVNCEDYGYAKSCLQYGNSIFTGSFDKGQNPDPVEALKYFQKGCEIGSDENCLNSGLLLVSPKLHGSALPRDLPKGIAFLSKSCDMNNGHACFYLSGIYMSGADSSFKYSTEKVQDVNENLEIAADMEKAFAFTQKACALKNIFACANLSQMYATGSGTQKNIEKSTHYKKVAEDLGEELRRQRILAHTHFKHP